MKACCSKESKGTKIKKYVPLIIIIAVSVLMTISVKASLEMSFFMGISFIFLSFLKLIDLKGFVKGFKNYDPFTKMFIPYGFIYPFLELGIGLYLLRGLTIGWVNVLGAVLLLLTGAGVIYQKVVKKNEFSCACMGAKIDVPLGAVSLFENLIMAGMLIYLVIN